MPWVDRTAVVADAEAEFSSLSLYTWDGDFFLGCNPKHSPDAFGNVSSSLMMWTSVTLEQSTLNVHVMLPASQKVCRSSPVDEDVDVDM